MTQSICESRQRRPLEDDAGKLGRALRRRIWLVLLLVALLAPPLILLRAYKLELIHTVVLNSVAQKAPTDFPRRQIDEAFSFALEEAETPAGKDAYLLRLLELSRRLEKIQFLTRADLEELLAEVRNSGAERSVP